MHVAKIAVCNKFHRTHTTINVTIDGYAAGTLGMRGVIRVWVNDRQISDARRRMCGARGCKCEIIGLPTPGWNWIRQNQIDGTCDVVTD